MFFAWCLLHQLSSVQFNLLDFICPPHYSSMHVSIDASPNVSPMAADESQMKATGITLGWKLLFLGGQLPCERKQTSCY